MDNSSTFTKLVLPRAKIVELTFGKPVADFFARMVMVHISLASLNTTVQSKKVGLGSYTLC